MYGRLRQKWLDVLEDPNLGPQYALLLTDTKSPWGVREVLQPRVTGHATDGATTALIAPDASAAGNRKLVSTDADVLILEQLDYYYREASGGALTAAINGGQLQLLIDDAEDFRLPKFALDYFYRGDAVLKFGKLPLGWVIPRGQSIKLNLIPSGTAGGLFDCAVDLLVRREPLWLMEAAGLIDAGAP